MGTLKYVFALIITVVIITPALSCDFCNCYLGLTPSYNKNSIGIRYKHSNSSYMFKQPGMRIQHGDEEHYINDGEEWNSDFTAIEIFGQKIITPKVRAMFFLPYNNNTFSYMDKTENENSIGDLTVIVHGQLYNSMEFDSTTTRHRLFAGGGIKLPTGNWKMDEFIDIPFAHDLMSGTGSTDFIASLQYIGSYKKFGWSVEMSYKYKTTNPQDYKFGNSYNGNVFAYYKVKVNNNFIIPYLKSSVETADVDQLNSQQLESSGGEIWWNGGGVEFHVSSFKIDLNFMVPSVQNLPGIQPEWNFRGVASVAYNF